MKELRALLGEATARTRALAEHLPKLVDASLSPKAKIPYKVLCYREGLIWRVEELSRSACDCFARDDVVAGILLTRSVIECAAAMWFAHRLIDQQTKDGVDKALDAKAMSLLLGHKNVEDMPAAIHVNDFIRKADKTFPGFMKMYDNLSEYAHPNWAGTQAVYSEIDHERLRTLFGRKLRKKSDHHARSGLHALTGALVLFVEAYNRVGDAMPNFITACEAALERRGSKGDGSGGR